MGGKELKPFIDRRYLSLISGLIWLAIGVMLSALAYRWLSAYQGEKQYLYAIAGVVLALTIHHFGFLRLVDKNMGRINTLEEQTCLFAFMSWRSYILVIIMISMGIILRHSKIPRNFLSVLYIGIGLALILSSIRYLRLFYYSLKKN